MSGSGRLGCVMGLVLLATLSATACGAGASSGPHSLPALSSSATPAATPTSSASPSTPAASGKAAELAAATAVVRRYYAVLDGLSTNMDAAGMAALMTTACTCHGLVGDIRRVDRAHEHYFGTVHLSSVRPSYNSPTSAEVLIRYNSAGGGLARNNGAILHRGKPTRGATLNFRLVRSRSSWLIYNIDLIDKGST